MTKYSKRVSFDEFFEKKQRRFIWTLQWLFLAFGGGGGSRNQVVAIVVISADFIHGEMFSLKIESVTTGTGWKKKKRSEYSVNLN